MGTVRESEGQGPVDGGSGAASSPGPGVQDQGIGDGVGGQQQQQPATLQSLLGMIQAAERLADVAASDSAGGVFEVLSAQQATSVQLGGMLEAGAGQVRLRFGPSSTEHVFTNLSETQLALLCLSPFVSCLPQLLLLVAALPYMRSTP